MFPPQAPPLPTSMGVGCLTRGDPLCPQLQLDMYRAFLSSKTANEVANGGKQTLVLASITSLKKLCNHPSLIVDNGKVAEGFESCVDMLPPSALPGRKGAPALFDPSLSGKFHVLHKLLKGVRATSDDKFVLISNYTQVRLQSIAAERAAGDVLACAHRNGWRMALRSDGDSRTRTRTRTRTRDLLPTSRTPALPAAPLTRGSSDCAIADTRLVRADVHPGGLALLQTRWLVQHQEAHADGGGLQQPPGRLVRLPALLQGWWLWPQSHRGQPIGALRP